MTDQVNKPSDIKKMKKLKKMLDEKPIPETAVPLTDGPPAGSKCAAGCPKTAEQAEALEKEKAAALDATHAEMWAALDGKSPFDWPDDARNLFQSGCTCSLWGRSVVDMSPDQRILFVAYVDTIASDLLAQCKGLAMAMEQVGAAKKGRKKPFGRRKARG